MKPLKVLFRVDSSIKIGTGHVMRCLALAKELITQQGATVEFISRDLIGNSFLAIENSGIKLHKLPPPDTSTIHSRSAYSEWLEVDLQVEIKQITSLLNTIKADWIIVDHYALDWEWEKSISQIVDNIAVIDDLALNAHHCQLLINQNFMKAENYKNLVNSQCALLLGPRYAMLRREFSIARGKIKPRKYIKNILIFMGGIDSKGATLKIIEAIKNLEKSDITIDVVVGSNNPQIEKIKDIVKEYSNFMIHVDVQNMAELMSKSDLAVGAAGTSSLERCAIGLPTITFSLAENQISGAKAMEAVGAIEYLGNIESVTAEEISQTIMKYFNSPETLIEKSNKAFNLVDGKGGQRVARNIIPPALKVRKALPSDEKNIFEWRNAESVRKYSKNKGVIKFKDHQIWFKSVMTSLSRPLLVVEDERGIPVAVLRYDIDDESAVVSVYLVPGMAGHGYGSVVLKVGDFWLKKQYDGIKRIRAEIETENKASLYAFFEAGYKEKKGYYEKELL